MAKLKTETVAGEKKKQTHHEKCGDVGITGEHGELGTNAAAAGKEADKDGDSQE
jgi:hypothetical protein